MNYPMDQWIELNSFEPYRDWKTPRGFYAELMPVVFC